MKGLILLLFAGIVCAPLSVFAADPAPKSTAEPAVKKAGNEDRFRVISRFDAPPPVSNPDETAFQAAYALFVKGEHDKALPAMKALDKPDFLLVDYARRFAAESALSTGDTKLARSLALSVDVRTPAGAEAQRIAALALLESAKGEKIEAEIKKAYAELLAFANANPTRSTTLDVRELLARSLEPAEAAEQWVRVIEDFPLSAKRTVALAELRRIAAKSPAAAQHLKTVESSTHRLKYINALYEAHRSQEVVDQLPPLIKSFKKGSAQWCEANFLLAHSFTKLRKHADSIPGYTQVVDHCKGIGNWQIRALYLGGRGLWNAKQGAKARVWFERIWTQFPEHSYADDAVYYASRIAREQNDPKADALLKMQVKQWPDGDMATDAHWLTLRPLFEKKAYKQVIAYIDQIKDRGEHDVYSSGRLAYFKARALELSKSSDAGAAYVAVVQEYPLSYYALLAYNRAQNLKVEVPIPTKPDAPIVIEPHIEQDPAFRRGMAMVRLGLDGLARLEFRLLEPQLKDEPEKLWALANLMHTARMYPFSHDIARRRISNWMVAYPDPVHRQRWEIAFPAPFDTMVRPYAESRKIEPTLVWAIMREESGFSPAIESWANARGLLQLMETTAARMAKLDKLDAFTGTSLFEPDVNIRLGTRYLQELAESVERHPVLMISGYNGGMGNVGRWQRESTSKDLDLWVEDIPFGQTRNYTKRVLQSFWIYAYLYENQRIPIFEMTIPAPKN